MTKEPVIADTSSLLNFILTQRLELLLSLPGFSFRIPPRVYGEIKPGRGREELLASIEKGLLLVEPLTEEEMERSEALRPVLGAGEAAVVAIALTRGWKALLDDWPGQRTIKDAKGKEAYLTTQAVILELIHGGFLTIEDADILKKEMEIKAHFRMKGFTSFRELLGQ